ncbi:hypothetical protein CERSUDRAFT_78018 [Gelatoporia subvermispora B]|uniref:Uncharacterized protein n=1 Tax=Ceriporiopsis subvermispora (strain B) TaxID=914234 RepID=M2QYF4_CERS8|nr:hypothetical protein CERSUDRAFT_78018 [Gelatoporia subvermispora B]
MFFVFPLLISLVFSMVHAISASDVVIPDFELIASGTLDVKQAGVFDVPIGERVSAIVTGGELYLPNGTLAATVVSGTGMGNGIVATDEIFYPSVYMTLEWAVDGKLAYVHVQGVGYMETNSEVWSSMNSRFMIGNMTFTDPPVLGIFGIVGA